LKNIFGTSTRFAILLLSKHYVEKFYTRYEFNVAKIEESNRDYEFRLPVRFDNASLKGLEEDKVYIDLRREGLFNTAEILMKKLRDICPVEQVNVPKEWFAAFGIVIEDLMENYELPASAPGQYAYLCDWLEEDLMKRLSKSCLGSLKMLEDSRDGETLTVKVGFEWVPEEGPLDFGDIGWWGVLEVAELESIYPKNK